MQAVAEARRSWTSFDSVSNSLGGLIRDRAG